MHGGNVHNFWATQYVVKIEEKSDVFIPNIRFLIVQKMCIRLHIVSTKTQLVHKGKMLFKKDRFFVRVLLNL